MPLTANPQNRLPLPPGWAIMSAGFPMHLSPSSPPARLLLPCLLLTLALMACVPPRYRKEAAAAEANSAVAALPATTAGTTSTTTIIFQLNNIKPAGAAREVEALKQVVGANPVGGKRRIGFGMVPPMLLAHSIPELRAIVESGFDLAEQHDLPVYFQVDDINSPPNDAVGPKLRYYDDPMMCEWSTFPTPGATHGTVPELWINWGQWFSRPAIPCLASPRLRGFARTQLREGVLKPLMARLEQLRTQDKAYLFAGINVGWETNIPDYRPGKPLYSIGGASLPKDLHAKPPRVMPAANLVQTGFGALHHLGYDAAKLSAAALNDGVSEETFFVGRCHAVIQSYSALLAEACRTAGLPRQQVHTHMIAIESAAAVESTMIPPIWAAVNRDSLPGFTLCQESGAIYAMPQLVEKIAAGHVRLDEPPQRAFVVAETYFRAAPTPEKMRAFLAELFGEGAVLINFWGWGDPASSPYFMPRTGETPFKAIIDWRANGPAPFTRATSEGDAS